MLVGHYGSGMSWVVQDDKTGFVVKHNNVESLVTKLAYIADNVELLSKYGGAGRKRFQRVFRMEVVSNEITSSCNELKGEKNKK